MLRRGCARAPGPHGLPHQLGSRPAGVVCLQRRAAVNLTLVPGDGDDPDTRTAEPGRRVAETPRRVDNERLRELLRRSALGQEDAFAELYDLTASKVHGVVLRVLRAPDLAVEVTQEVFVEIWRECTRYSAARGSVTAWMVTIAHRRAVDRVRATASQTARDDQYARSEPPRGDEVWETTRQHLDADRVRAGLRALTDIQREALALAYFGGYSQAQVAKLLKVPLGTVKTRMRDGLIRLRDELGVQL
jgi:RNA polymerase sigma-70 factor, ECF subfamily